MNVATASRLLDVSPDTVRRWCSDYKPFLSPGATPPKGGAREFNQHDLRAFNYVNQQRIANVSHEDIFRALVAMREAEYAELPDVPDNWFWDQRPDGRVAMNEAVHQAERLAELAVFQVQNQTLRAQLEEAEQRAERLQAELDELRSVERTSQGQIHSLELELSDARGQVTTLTAQLEQGRAAIAERDQLRTERDQARADTERLKGEITQYTLGRGQPVNVGLIMIIALAVGAALTAALFILARMLV
jgi:DNA-binding transcriptional MerR regulator